MIEWVEVHLMTEKIDEYLKQGIYGQKQTKPDERRRYLGTLRERTVIVLTQPQVRKQGVMSEVEAAIKQNQKARLYLNGHMGYEDISKYSKIATIHHVEYTIVTNKDYNSELGLVLAYDHAIDKEEVYVKDEKPKIEEAEQKKGVLSFIKKVLKRG